MPPRADNLTRSWNVAQLPILPFLAPRIFAPWLYPSRGVALFGSQAVDAKAQRVEGDGTDTEHERLESEKSRSNFAGEGLDDPNIYKTLPNGARKYRPPRRPVLRYWESTGPYETFKRKFIENLPEKVNGKKRDRLGVPITNLRLRKQVSQGRDRRTQRKADILRVISARGTHIHYTFVSKCGTGAATQRSAFGKSIIALLSREDRKALTPLSPREARLQLSQARVLHAIRARKQSVGEYGLRKSVSGRRQAWHKQFSLIDPNHSGFMDAWTKQPDKTHKRPLYKVVLPKHMKSLLIQHESSNSLSKSWSRLPERTRVKYWPDLICSVLKQDPEKALKVLVGTYSKPYPPGYAVGNCLDFLISYYLTTPYLQNPSFRSILETKTGNVRSKKALMGPQYSTSGIPNDKNVHQQIIGQQSAMSVIRRLSTFHTQPGFRRRRPWADTPNPNIIADLFGAIIRLLTMGPANFRLSQKSFYLFLMTMDIESIKILYHKTKQLSHFWSDDNLFMFADRFAKAKDSRLAIELLQKLQERQVDFNDLPSSFFFCTLLHSKYRDIETSYSDAMIWNYMTSCGLIPQARHYNVLMLNAIKRGEHDTPWAIHDSMVEDGVKPNGVTYSILFNHAKNSLNQSSLGRVLHLVREKNIPPNIYLANDHLHSIFLTYREDDRNNHLVGNDQFIDGNHLEAPRLGSSLFELMLPIYCQYFEGYALAFGMGSLVESYPQLDQPSGGRMEPNQITMNIMFAALLYGFKHSSQVIEAYRIFRNTLHQSDKPYSIARLHNVEIYNAFIMAFGKHSETLRQCPQVVEDMLTTSKAGNMQHRDQGSGHPASNNLSLQLVPDAYTWTTLITIYMSHKQPHAAQRVLDIMIEQGVTPVDVTWGAMAVGHAKLQNIQQTVQAAHQLTSLTNSTNEFAVLALSKINDNEGLREAIEAMQRESGDQSASIDADEKKSRSQLADLESGAHLLRIKKAVVDLKQTSWMPREYWQREPEVEIGDDGLEEYEEIDIDEGGQVREGRESPTESDWPNHAGF